MAKQLNCGRSSIQRSLDRLVEAGWVEKKRPPWSNETGAPSHSYMYRVILDRDDYVPAPDDEEPEESHAEIASEEGDCPPMGSDEMPADGHPGAQPYVGTGAQPYVGTKNASLERPPIERERDARARDRKARFLVSFEARWPTAAADDRQRTAYAAEALTEDEEEPALAGIAPFLEDLKRHHRKGVPAGWKYLEQKRWTLLAAAQAASTPVATNYPRDSREATAILLLFAIAGVTVPRHRRRSDGSIDFNHPVTPQILALTEMPAKDDWVLLTRQQAAAWEALLREALTVGVRRPIREGDRAPWPWPPSVDGKLYTGSTGPPLAGLSDQELADFK
jgi:hypothetical protein